MLSLLFRHFASNRSQQGLYHGKDIHTGYSYTFSHKATKREFRPNVHRKEFWSDTLKRPLTIEVSMKALKCIRKAGGLDNYLLKTSNENMRSKFGELLRSFIVNKQQHPDWKVPYIPRSWKKPKRWNDNKEHRNAVLWKPIELRNEDQTRYMFDVYDPNAPPEVDPVESTDEEKKEEVEKEDDVGPEIRKIRRQLDDDTQKNLGNLIETAKNLGIDHEAEEEVKQKSQKDSKITKKSRSRQAYEKKMKKIEDRIAGVGKVDTKIMKELKESIFALKGGVKEENKKDKKGNKK